MQKLLILGPGFHGYLAAVAAGFEELGYQTKTCDYDVPTAFPGKISNKFRVETKQHTALKNAYAKQAMAAVTAFQPDRLLIIKGDLLGDLFWQATQDLPRIVWFYDELAAMNYSVNALPGLGKLATFSSQDASSLNQAGISILHLPLAFDSSLTAVDTRIRNDEVTFAGNRYPKREAWLHEIQAAGIPTRAYGRSWSRHPIDRLRTLSWQRPNLPTEREISRADAYQEMAASLASLNIHGGQSGFTIRTFEICGVGGLQLIDRADVSGLYRPGVEVLVAESPKAAIKQIQKVAANPTWAEEIRLAGQERTLTAHTFKHRAEQLVALWD